MSETTLHLIRKIEDSRDLQSIVRAMRTMAAAKITQYEGAANSLQDYYYGVELGIAACLKKKQLLSTLTKNKQAKKKSHSICVIVFGSDQNLVGQFNDEILSYSVKILKALPEEPHIWTIGKSIAGRLQESGLSSINSFHTPSSVQEITNLTSEIILETSSFIKETTELHLIYNKMVSPADHVTERKRLLPFDQSVLEELTKRKWPTKKTPEIIGDDTKMLGALIREYILVFLYQACLRSLVCENTILLNTTQRADKNIDKLLKKLHKKYYSLRQNAIDEELFDLIVAHETLLSY